MKVIHQILILFSFIFPAIAQEKAFTIQIASTKAEAEARLAVSHLQDIQAYYSRFENEKGTWYRVRIGKFRTEAQARAYATKLVEAKKITEYVIFHYEQTASHLPISSPAKKTTTSPSPSLPVAPSPFPSVSASPHPRVPPSPLPNSSTTTFQNDRVSFEYPIDWKIAAQHDTSDLFIFDPARTSFISISTRQNPFTELNNETISTMLNAVKQSTGVTNIDIQKQTQNHDGQFAEVEFKLKYNEAIYNATLLLKLKAGNLIEISILSPATNKTNAHRIVRETIKF